VGGASPEKNDLAIGNYGPMTREMLAFARLFSVLSRKLTDGAELDGLRSRVAACLLVGGADDAIELTGALIDG
jgi:hypothetical protein